MGLKKLTNALVATVGAGAFFVGLGVTPASADLLPFGINPSVLATGGPYAVQTATDLNGVSNALLQQVGPTTQVETGYLQMNGFTNNGANVNSNLSRLVKEGDIGSPASNVYNLYITFKGTTNGISGFGAGLSGTVGAGDYQFALWADLTSNDTFSTGATSTSGGTAPSVGNTAGDVLLAIGSSISGSVGQAANTGAPFFDVLASFILCNGTAGQGLLGGQVVAASNNQGTCGTFNGSSYFVSPIPFYKLDFNSSISGSSNNLVNPVGLPNPNVLLNGVVADINFVNIPEPSTLSMFGAALLGLGLLFRRRKANSNA
jgi:hypothetical protein